MHNSNKPNGDARIHPADFAKIGLVSLSSMLDDTFPVKGYAGRKPCTGNQSARVEEGAMSLS